MGVERFGGEEGLHASWGRGSFETEQASWTKGISCWRLEGVLGRIAHFRDLFIADIQINIHRL